MKNGQGHHLTSHALKRELQMRKFRDNREAGGL
jgi:hypothetical protein